MSEGNDPSVRHRYILTAAADFLDAAVDEVRRADRTVREVSRPDSEIAVVEAKLDLPGMHAALQRQEPVFLRHIVPAQASIPLSGDKKSDLDALADATMALPELSILTADDTFSIQARVAYPEGERPYSPYAIKTAIAPGIQEATNAVEDVRSPEIVISVLAVPSVGYVGISPVQFNRSDWAGGARRFAREEGQLSRSEFKLLEALEVFDVTLPDGGQALDLGAAPGGWTRILVSEGLRVTAVDPAEVDISVGRDPRVKVIQGYAQEWIEKAVAENKKYDVIVNDMRMDARDAARLMVDVAPLMHLDSFAIITLKLPGTEAPGMDPFAILRQSLEELRSRFRTVRARQLFHNRNEVTVYLQL